MKGLYLSIKISVLLFNTDIKWAIHFIQTPKLENCGIHLKKLKIKVKCARLGVVYTMHHEVIPRPSKRCDWTLKSSQDDLGLHQGKNGRVTTEVEVHNFF